MRSVGALIHIWNAIGDIINGNHKRTSSYYHLADPIAQTHGGHYVRQGAINTRAPAGVKVGVNPDTPTPSNFKRYI